MAPRRAAPLRQPDHRVYRQVPTPWGQMPLPEIGAGTESAEKMLGACALGPVQLTRTFTRAGEAQESPHPPGVEDGPFDQSVCKLGFYGSLIHCWSWGPQIPLCPRMLNLVLRFSLGGKEDSPPTPTPPPVSSPKAPGFVIAG